VCVCVCVCVGEGAGEWWGHTTEQAVAGGVYALVVLAAVRAVCLAHLA